MSIRHNQIFFLSVLVLVQTLLALSIDAKPERHSTLSAVSDSKNSYKNNSGSRFNSMMPSPFTSRPLSLREQIEIAAYIQVQDSIYREKFHMGFYEFNHAMRLGYKDFIHKAFHDLRLSDQAMSELWQEYLDSSWWKRPSQVEKYSKVVQEKIKKRNKRQKAKQKLQQEALDRKNKDIVIQQEAARKKETERRLLTEQRAYEKQLAIEEQKRLAHALLEQEAKKQQEALIFYEQMIKNQYQACDFDIANCPDPELEKQWNDRQEALSKTTQQDFMQFDQAYYLTPQTVGFLAAHDVDYKDYQGFFGTDLQQQLHGEMCDALSQAATVPANFLYQSNLQTSVVEFADAAYDANKNQQILLASQLMDVDWIVLRLSREIATAAIPYGKAFVSGAAHSAIDFLHMAGHPIETCKGLGRALYFVLETTALNCSEVVLQYPEIYEPKRDKRNSEISQALQSLGNQIANSTGPQRVEAITRFGADFIVPGKIIHAVGGVCGAVRSQAKIMRRLEGVASVLGDELGFEKVAQELILATEQLEVVAQENIGHQVAIELMEAEAQVAKTNPTKPGLIVDAQLIEERIIQARQHFSSVIQDSLEEVKMLSLKYEKVALEFEGSIQNIAIDVEHIFLPEIKPNIGYNKLSNMQELKDMRFTGWHYGYLSEFEKSGLIEIVKKIIKNDCTYVEFTWQHGNDIIPKTLFPNFWSRQQVLEKILEAMSNIIEIKERNGRFLQLGKTITGKTVEGIEIEMKLTRNALEDPWKMATAYVKQSYITGIQK